MHVEFEPGQGVFDIIIERDEAIPPEWNATGVKILRQSELGLVRVKDYDEVLKNVFYHRRYYVGQIEVRPIGSVA